MVIILCYLKLPLYDIEPIISLKWVLGATEGRRATLQEHTLLVSNLLDLLWRIVLCTLHILRHLLHELCLHHEELFN